jgi:hypothetical protein
VVDVRPLLIDCPGIKHLHSKDCHFVLNLPIVLGAQQDYMVAASPRCYFPFRRFLIITAKTHDVKS